MGIDRRDVGWFGMTAGIEVPEVNCPGALYVSSSSAPLRTMINGISGLLYDTEDWWRRDSRRLVFSDSSSLE
jgi:hypothetical protein